MSDVAPPGWYTDPEGSRGERYFDGTGWTEQVRPGAGARPVNPYGAGPAAYGPATTPDGQELAGWWRRVWASVVDSIVVTPIGLLLAWPWFSEVVSTYLDFFEETMDAAERGGTAPSAMELQGEVIGQLFAIVLVGLAVSFVYHVGFLLWRQATPGKLLLGLRVRLRDRPGPMPLGTVVVRWLTQFAPAVGGVVPVVQYLTQLYSLLDALWPLWDQRKQAIHDKAARTNVVVHRP